MARLSHYCPPDAKVANDPAANLISFQTLQRLVWIPEKTDAGFPPATAWEKVGKVVQITVFSGQSGLVARYPSPAKLT